MLAMAWYRDLLGASEIRIEEVSYTHLDVDGACIEFHRADAKCAPGAAGQIGYFAVEDFSSFVARAEAMGANIYRGPMAIDGRRQMAQMTDPFGNVFGVRG